MTDQLFIFQVQMNIYRSNWNHHHHHVAPPARISLTVSRHFSLSFIASGRSSGLHPVVLTQLLYVGSCWSSPTLAHPCVGVHRSTSLMSSSLLLQQCPACLVRRTCIVFVMGAGVRIVGVSWGVVARTCLILLSTFLYNFRPASFPAAS